MITKPSASRKPVSVFHKVKTARDTGVGTGPEEVGLVSRTVLNQLILCQVVLADNDLHGAGIAMYAPVRELVHGPSLDKGFLRVAA
ncbi:uncharacterized [Tachysurus ichikawai]